MSIIKTAYVIIAKIKSFHIFNERVSPQHDKTALHYASGNGHPEVVKLLMQCHPDVNIKGYVSTESPH